MRFVPDAWKMSKAQNFADDPRKTILFTHVFVLLCWLDEGVLSRCQLCRCRGVFVNGNFN